MFGPTAESRRGDERVRKAASGSRAAAAAQRRITASEKRKKAQMSDVLLLTSKNFPPDQYQTLLNFVRGLHLPTGACSLLTTVPADRMVQMHKANLLSPSRVDEILHTYGNKWVLLSQCLDEIGAPNSADASRSSPERPPSANSNSEAQRNLLNRAAHRGSSPTKFEANDLQERESSPLLTLVS